MEIVFIPDNAKVTSSVPGFKSKQEEREKRERERERERGKDSPSPYKLRQ